MAARLIRDDMLDSERIHSVPIEARWLFVAIMLSADDVGLFEVNKFRLARKAGVDMLGLPALLQCLADADLIRPYYTLGKHFGFIPRFRQRLQIKRARFPLPPTELMSDDADALNKIKHLGEIPRLDNAASPLPTAVQPPEPEPEPEQRAKTEKAPRKRGAAAAQLVSVEQLVEQGVDQQVAKDWLIVRKAKTLPLTPTAWDETKAEALKAGLSIADAIKTATANGWGGFRASWMNKPDVHRVGGFGQVDKTSTVPPKETAAEYVERMARERAASVRTPEQIAASKAARDAALARHKVPS